MAAFTTAVCASAADIYVDSSASADGDGSIGAPYKSLSVAIGAAQSEDVIKIAVGLYVPDANDNPKDHIFKILEKTLVLEGGYNSDFSAITGYSTLSGDVNGDDVYDELTGILKENYEDNCDRVLTIATNANVTLKNLIIKGGNADDATNKLDTGGGMYIGSPVVLENCVITGNRCTNSAGGGGICFKDGSLTMKGCVLKGNSLEGDGGALYVKGDIPVTVTHCLFEYNLSTSGSAVFISNSTKCYFASNTFRHNQSATYGTFTIYNKNYEQAPVLVNNTFANNRVSGNTAGKTLLGGAGVYVFMKATAQLSMVNNTIIGNSVEGTDAEGNTSEDLGGALYGRQGKVLLANNVIAGNTSLSGYGDIYTLTGFEVNSKEYNFYTSNDNVSITPGRNDIVADFTRADGMLKVPTVFEGSHDQGSITANCVHNGGQTPTVKAHGENVDFYGLTIKSVPAENLSEAALGVDLDDDGEKTGTLKYDQRGAVRNQTGSAFIGAYENDGQMTKVANILKDSECMLKVVGSKVIVPADCECNYMIVTMAGETIASATVQNGEISLDELGSGCYVVSVKGESFSGVVKVIR